MVSKAVLKTQPDGKLATLAAAGSEPAFEAIVHRYRRPLLGYCRRLRLSDNRSEDVVQQTFLNAWGSLRDGTEVRELRPWLYRITHNQAVTMMRATGRDETPLSDLTMGPLEEMSESTWAAADVYERQARLKETLTAVAALPVLQREALLATAVDGLSYDQVAVVLNTSSDAVRGLVYRARNTLRTGVAVLSPGPLVIWAANQAGQAVSANTVQQWLTETTAGGGTIGLGAVAVKGAVVLASSAAVVTGTVGVGLDQHVFSAHSAGSHSDAVAHAASAPATGHPATSHAAADGHLTLRAPAVAGTYTALGGARRGALTAVAAAHLGATLAGSRATVASQQRTSGGAHTVSTGAEMLGAGTGMTSATTYATAGAGTGAAGSGSATLRSAAPSGMQMGSELRPQAAQQQPPRQPQSTPSAVASDGTETTTGATTPAGSSTAVGSAGATGSQTHAGGVRAGTWGAAGAGADGGSGSAVPTTGTTTTASTPTATTSTPASSTSTTVPTALTQLTTTTSTASTAASESTTTTAAAQ